MNIRAWVEAYGRAWQEGDPEATAALFTEDAAYRASPFREPYVGRDAILAYALRTSGEQTRKDVRMGEPLVDGDRVAVEWWTTMVDEGEEVTLPGCLLLRLAPDGRCRELREYWHLEPGRHDPHEGWGR